jgi:hypothetical protein
MIPNAGIVSMIVASLEDDALTDTSNTFIPRTELDSHANMFVAGKHAYVLAQSGKTATVHAFSPDIPPTEIPIVDCAFLYECPFSVRKIVHPGGTECAPCAYHGTQPCSTIPAT